MKKLMSFIISICLIANLSSCQTTATAGKKAGNSTKRQSSAIKSDKQLLTYFQRMAFAANHLEKKAFMSYQNTDNALFYKEQDRWIEEVGFKRQQGYKVETKVSRVKRTSKKTAAVDLLVTMTSPSPSSSTFANNVTYQAIKTKSGWKLNDLPYKKVSSAQVTVYYLNGEENLAKKVETDAIGIINSYEKVYKWVPHKAIAIKLYSDRYQISATVPWPLLAGWNEYGESIKILAENGKMDHVFTYLSHELTHKMLSEMSNDNTSLYFQEGFATYDQIGMTQGADGKVSFDSSKEISYAKEVWGKTPNLLSVTELNQKDYTGGGDVFYTDGYLLTNYVIEKYGMKKFLAFIHDMKSSPYIDTRAEHKLRTINPITTAAINKEFGSAEQLSKGYLNYYKALYKEKLHSVGVLYIPH